MSKIIDRNGKGAALSHAEMDANIDSACFINEAQTGTTHTIDVNDQNKVIEYSNASAIAVTLPAITAVSGSNIDASDFKVTLKNVGAGVVTVTRGSTNTFDDGSTSIVIAQYSSITIQTDSGLTKWNVISDSRDTGGGVLLGSATAAISATISFITGINSTYSSYIVKMTNIVPASDSRTIFLRFSDDGGSTYKSGASDYRTNGAAGAQITLTPSISNVASEGGFSGEVHIYAPSDSGVYTTAYCSGHAYAPTPASSEAVATSGSYDTAAAIDGFQFSFSSGNITSGTFKLYGIR